MLGKLVPVLVSMAEALDLVSYAVAAISKRAVL